MEPTVIKTSEEWQKYRDQLADEHGGVLVHGEPDELPCIVVATLKASREITHGNKYRRHKYVLCQFVYASKAEELLQEAYVC